MTTLREIKGSYSGERRESGIKDPWAHYVARPLSFYIAWPLIKLRMSANTVTAAGLVLGVAGCALLAHGSYWGAVIGAVLVNLYGLSDYVDGAIARATNTTSEYGARIDGASYLIVLALLFVAVGAGLDGSAWLMIGIAASYIRVFRYAITYQHNIGGEGQNTNMFYRLGMIAITLREPLLLVCALAGVLHVFLVFYLAVNSLELGVVMVRAFRRER